MKELFPEYYRPTDQGFDHLWRRGYFVPDANILLHLLRYRKEDASMLFSIFERFSDRVWIPHQVASEYHRNKDRVIIEIEQGYAEVIKALENAAEDAKKRLSNLNKGTHPFIDFSEEIDKVEQSFNRRIKRMKEKQGEHPSREFFQDRCDKIANLFSGKVGPRMEDERLEEIYKEGRDRYERSVPPGYSDASKDEPYRQYGDLVVWFQMIDKSKADDCPVVFITDDGKEDWWQREHGQTIGPRPELRKEFMGKTNHEIYIYDFNNFLKIAGKTQEDEDSKHLEKIRKTIRDQYKTERIAEQVYGMRSELQRIDAIVEEKEGRRSALDADISRLLTDMEKVGPQERRQVENRFTQLREEIDVIEQEIASLKAERRRIRHQLRELYTKYPNLFPSDFQSGRHIKSYRDWRGYS